MTRPRGFLPVFSCDTEEEARSLVAATCQRGLDGEYYAGELAHEQTLANLELFAQKLERVAALRKKRP